ncbi:MAG: Gldg family protein [Nitrospinae bacterium]|nr:Gldg family protein [Nitrospinota bacterium]
MAAYIFVVAGLFALVNFISAKNYRKADFTSGGRHSLSQQTTTLVGRLPYEIKTLAFVKDAEGARASNKHLLQQYEDHGKNFKWEFVDPDKKPGIAKEHGVTQYNTFVVLGREGKKETITGELSEEKLTNALFRLIATKDR